VRTKLESTITGTDRILLDAKDLDGMFFDLEDDSDDMDKVNKVSSGHVVLRSHESTMTNVLLARRKSVLIS
jgi:hypothetical protein